MKKILVILLSIMILFVTGCNSAKNVVTDVNYDETQETSKSGDSNPEDTTEQKSNHKAESKTTAEGAENKSVKEITALNEDSTRNDVMTENSEQTPSKQDEATNSPDNPNKPTETQTPTPAQTSTPTKTPEPEVVGYNPDKVVALAIAKCQAGGMITTQDNLTNALNEGRITLEEYNEYYPYDGLENSYYSVFVETDLNSASTTSGQPLRSEDAIATYIADMLLLETTPVFNIVYAGKYNLNGTEFYEFRCLR